jgi:filamentous hemagglutinin family protein
MNYKNLLSTTALLFTITVANSVALPVGGVVQNGAANISTAGNKTTVTQTTGRVDIDWTDFDIGSGQEVQFVQPSASALAINRVNSNTSTSIAGTLTANGRVVLINTNGITFANGAAVNVGALVATTSFTPISDNETSPASLDFSRSSKSAGAIINNGNIKVPAGGTVAFIAPTVTNGATGVITQQTGKAGAINVDMFGGEFRKVTFGGSPSLTYTIPTSKLANIAVTNSGTINGGGGVVVLTASDTTVLTNSVMNLNGVVDVSSLSSKKSGGTLVAQSAGSLTSAATVNGDASAGNLTTTKGGTVTYRAGGALVANGNISVDGGENGAGGVIALTSTTGAVTKGDSTTFNATGGTTRGKGGTVAHTAKTTLTVGGTIDVSSPTLGDGGVIVLKATDSTLTRRSGLNLNAAGGLDSTPDTNAGKGGTITYLVKNNTMLANGLSGSGITVNASPRSDSAAAGTVKVDYSTGTDQITSCTTVNSGC